jgi:hypothetical protein
MGIKQVGQLRERVRQAAEVVLEHKGSVGPLELLCQMQLLSAAHFDGWRKGREYYKNLEVHIQGSQEKIQKSYQFFFEWVQEKGLQSVPASYFRAGPRGTEPLQVTLSGDPEAEEFYRIHYAPSSLSPARAERLKEKLNKSPEIVVFQLTGKESRCFECETNLTSEVLFCLENEQPLCLACADLDHLEFLPSGDATLTRRARKHSPLAAVVVRFNRRRKRYERQGILVTSEAIAQAEESCAGDAEQRAALREKARIRREEEDGDLVLAMTKLIADRFPSCPAEEAQQIAAHTARRGSGRVGRSAAGRDLDPQAIDLAVIAWIRHQHTPYDELLMAGQDRSIARDMIRAEVTEVEYRWRESRDERGPFEC